MTDKNQIVIDDNEVIELPFHMIPTNAFAPDEKKMRQLKLLLPEDEELLVLMERKHRKVNKKEKNGELDKSFETQDYERIREWLER